MRHLIGGLILSGMLLFGNAATAQERPAAESVVKADDVPNPRDVLRTGRKLYVNSFTGYLKASLLEVKLMDRPEFERWGLRITNDLKDADLVIEVERSVFTTSFIYRVIEPKSKTVLISDKCNSLFGTASGKIADNFINRLKKVRPLPPKPVTPSDEGQRLPPVPSPTDPPCRW